MYMKEKQYSSFKNIMKPSREGITFYCICIIHVYLVRMYSWLFIFIHVC